MLKQNYNQLMKEQIKNITGKPKLLLHVCCAPCTSGSIPRLMDYFDITLYYFNPNTYPENEYILRAQQFAKLCNLPIVICDYNHNQFLSAIKDVEQGAEGGIRCQKCIKLRLENSFEYAKLNNFDYVTTTLSISPHKDSCFINSTGEELQQKYNIHYLYADLKKENGYLNSITESKRFGLYRQDYCGCEFSIHQQK